MTDPVPFGTRLVRSLSSGRAQLCVGVDPHPSLLAGWGLPDDASGAERLGRDLMAAVGDQVAVVKPQSAFFEAYGSAGIAALERVIADAQAAGALVLLDVKRGDIGSTMAAYARAYLADGSPLAVDAITVSPYLGFGSLDPALELAEATGRGVFVLAHTSNPESATVQLAVHDGRTVGQAVVDAVADRNAGAEPLGSVGIVVGATAGEVGTDFSRLNGPVLAPGVGAQGGTLDDLRRLFGDALRGVLPSTSRQLIGTGPDRSALRAAVDGLRF